MQAVDSRIFRANRTAMQILGVKPDEIVGLLGTSFFPDTPEAQRRLRDALPLLATGTDEKGVVFELRRKDDGRPLWVRWWCRPEPTGGYTRSMFIDVTDQVLMEQQKARLETSRRLPARRNSHRTEFRRHHRGKFRAEKGDAAGSTRCADRCYRPDHLGKRYRQRARRSRDT